MFRLMRKRKTVLRKRMPVRMVLRHSRTGIFFKQSYLSLQRDGIRLLFFVEDAVDGTFDLIGVLDPKLFHHRFHFTDAFRE